MTQNFFWWNILWNKKKKKNQSRHTGLEILMNIILSIFSLKKKKKNLSFSFNADKIRHHLQLLTARAHQACWNLAVQSFFPGSARLMTLKTPLHYISPFSQHTLYIPWKINHIMKIWINLNKWLHIICLTLKTMTTVYTQSSKLLSAVVRDWAAEATDRCSHYSKEHHRRSRWGSVSQVCARLHKQD